MKIDLDYLAEIATKVPSSGCRWGVSHDGQTLAMVGYAICDSGRLVTKKDRKTLFREQSPLVFYACNLKATISQVLEIFDQVADVMGELGLTLHMEGGLGKRENFIRMIKQHGKHGVVLFREEGGKLWEISEVIGAVADDTEMGVIQWAPEFQNRTEQTVLMDEISSIESGERLTPMQAAHLWGLGYWCCLKQRQKFTIGAGPRMW